MSEKFLIALQQILYSMRMQRIMQFAATKPRTRYEIMLEARTVRPQVSDHAIKIQINKMISLRILKPLGSRPSVGGPPREVRRYILSEGGAQVLRGI